MRKYVALSLVSLALCACSKTQAPAIPESPAATQTSVTTTSTANKDQHIVKPTWSMNLSNDWLVETLSSAPDADPLTEFRAKSKVAFGRGSVIVSVASSKFDDGVTEQNFGQLMVETAKSIDSLQIVATSDATVKHGNKEVQGTLLGFIAPGGIVVVQLSVGHKGRGYVVRCMGDLRVGQEVLSQCQSPVTSFELR